ALYSQNSARCAPREFFGASGGGNRAGLEIDAWTCILPVHQLRANARSSRAAGGDDSISTAAARDSAAVGAARAISRDARRGAARDGEFLARRGRTRFAAFVRDY